MSAARGYIEYDKSRNLWSGELIEVPVSVLGTSVEDLFENITEKLNEDYPDGIPHAKRSFKYYVEVAKWKLMGLIPLPIAKALGTRMVIRVDYSQ